MGVTKRVVTALPFVPLVGAGYVLAQILRAAHRSDLPSFPNQEPSGTFGDAASPPLRIVGVGDSSLTSPGVQHIDNTWFRRVALHTAQRFHVEAISLGVGGSKAHDVVEGQLAAAERLVPDIGIISVGANDALRGVSARSFRRRLDEITRRLHGVARGVVLVGMGDISSVPRLPPSIRPYVSRRSRQFNDITLDVANGYPRAVKVETRTHLSTAFFENPSLFCPDQFHAGDSGHEVFASVVIPAVDEAIRLGGIGT